MRHGFKVIRPEPHLSQSYWGEWWDYQVGQGGELSVIAIQSGVGRFVEVVFAAGTWHEIQPIKGRQ